MVNIVARIVLHQKAYFEYLERTYPFFHMCLYIFVGFGACFMYLTMGGEEATALLAIKWAVAILLTIVFAWLIADIVRIIKTHQKKKD